VPGVIQPDGIEIARNLVKIDDDKSKNEPALKNTPLVLGEEGESRLILANV
jgi:hypothetical protein